MRAASKKRAAQLRTYSHLRVVFLEGHPVCEFPSGCLNAATDVHHRAGRSGARLNDVDHWSALCRSCHEWTTVNPRAAYDLGISERRVS